MTIVEFLRARYDHAEAHARKDIWAADRATEGNWRASYGVNLPASHVEAESSPVARLDGARHEADALLIARFKPDTVRARAELVLREVEAKRRVVDECARTPEFEDYGCWLAKQVLVSLALPYADHSDYDPTWSPA